jgi:hypothetical protein
MVERQSHLARKRFGRRWSNWPQTVIVPKCETAIILGYLEFLIRCDAK